MNFVIILLGNPKLLKISDHLQKLQSFLQGKNISFSRENILKENTSLSVLCDITDNRHENIMQYRRELYDIFHPEKIDVALVHKDKIGIKKLAIADMDSTLIGQECIDELADFVNKKKEISDITNAAMRGEIDFSQSLNRRVSLLKGLELSHLQDCFDQKITLMAGAKTWIDFMNDHKSYTALASGGFTFFAQLVAQALGIKEFFANQLISHNGTLTGEVIPPILDANRKKQILLDLCKQYNIAPIDTIAVGDGANDIPMLETAGLSVAYYAKPALMAAADVSLFHTDLSSLIYLQTALINMDGE